MGSLLHMFPKKGCQYEELRLARGEVDLTLYNETLIVYAQYKEKYWHKAVIFLAGVFSHSYPPAGQMQNEETWRVQIECEEIQLVEEINSSG